MATVIDSLVLEFNLDVSQFTREQRRLMEQLRRLEEDSKTQAINIEAQFKRIGNLFANLQRGAISIIGGFFGGEALRMFDYFNRAEAQIGRIAQVIGLSAEKTQAWSQTFEAFGYSSQEGLAALQATTATIQQALITGDVSGGLFRVAAALGRPGMPRIDLLHGGAGGGAMTAPEAWVAISRQLDRLGIQGPQRGAWLQQAGLPQFLLMEPTRKLEQMVEEMAKLAPLTAAQVKQAQEYQANVAKLNTAFVGLGEAITNQVTPALLKLADWLKAFLPTFNPQDPAGVSSWTDWLGAGAVHDWLGTHLTPAGKSLIGFDTGRGGAATASANDAEREAFIRATARSLGLDPDLVVSVWSGEGRYGLGPRKKSTIPGEESYGDFQGNLRPGSLGTQYEKETGRQIGDPRFWKEEDLWMLQHMRYDPAGLAPWHAHRGDPHAGGAGQGTRPNQHVSFHIEHMHVNGDNSAEVAANLGRQTERIKMAYYGNNAAV